MNEVFKTGAVFDLVNNFSPELAKVIGGLETFDKAVLGSQAELKKFGFGNLAARTDKQLDALVQATSLAVDKMIGHFGRVDEAIRATMSVAGKLGATMSGDLDAAAKVGADGVIGNLANVDKALTGSVGEVAKLAGVLSGDLTTAAGTATTDLVAGFGRVDGSIGTAVASAAALKTEIGLAAVAASGIHVPSLPGSGGSGPGAGMGPRAARGNHSGGGGGHGGFHFRAPGMHIPGGGHVGISEGSSGMVPAIGALAAGETMAKAIEHAFDFDHWVAILKANGMSADRIDAAKQAAWANAGANPNASATESLKTIIELNKVTGNLEESMKLLPTFSVAESGMQSVKAKNLHSQFNADGQVFNFAKSLEEMNATQNPQDKAPEERAARVKLYARELLRTMITSNGTFDGNAAFAMTNNSGGASQNWDMNMATIVAPLLGDIMKHSKLGNADYMALKSYAGGGITSKATAALVKYGLADADKDTYTDKTGIHLNANSGFAEGITENIWTWAQKKLEVLKAHGTDINNQEEMNKIINEIGSNKSTTMLMRAVLEPGTRNQMQKELNQRGLVPEDAAGILTQNDPVLKLDAIHKKWDDFLTALGGPMTDVAIKALTSIAGGLNTLAQAMEAHPEATKNIGIALGGIAVGLGALAAVAFVSFVPGGAVVLGLTTLASSLTALAAVNWGMFQKGGAIDTALTSFFTGIIDTLRQIPGLGRLIPGAPAKEAFGPPMPPSMAPNAPAYGADNYSYGMGFSPMAYTTSGANDNSSMVDALAQGVFRGLQMYANGGGASGGLGGGGGSGVINASYEGGGFGGGGLGGTFSGSRNPGAKGWWTTDRQSHAVDVLMQGGVSELGAKALVSRWMNVEASGGPSTVNGIGATGIGQWLGNRKRGLPSDFDGQLRHALGELHGSEGRALGYLNSGSALGAATGASQFERAEGYNSRTGMDNFTGRTLRGMGSIAHDHPVAGAPPSRTVAPGKPAAAQHAITAMNTPQHIHVYVGDEKVAHHVAGRMVAAMEHPNAVGGPDTYGSWQGPATPLNDAA